MSNPLHFPHTASEPPIRIELAQYDTEEVVATFSAILHSLDFHPMLEALGMGKRHIFRRKKAVKELQALSIGLWKLALQRSFPNDFELFYEAYLETIPQRLSPKEAAQFQARINTYNNLLTEKRETDFTPVAKYLADIFTDNEDTSKRFTLKLSLLLRNVYTIIFDNLV